jgi:hypothetical protein
MITPNAKENVIIQPYGNIDVIIILPDYNINVVIQPNDTIK